MNNDYYEMFAKVKDGQITEQDWFDYCSEMLNKIMEDNKDIFIRMKKFDTDTRSYLDNKKLIYNTNSNSVSIKSNQ